MISHHSWTIAFRSKLPLGPPRDYQLVSSRQNRVCYSGKDGNLVKLFLKNIKSPVKTSRSQHHEQAYMHVFCWALDSAYSTPARKR